MPGAAECALALYSLSLTDPRQAHMQFFLTDLALTFAALIGYRALEAAMRRRAPVTLLQRRAPRGLEYPKPVRPRAEPSCAPRHKDVPRAPLHRLINFW